MLQKYKGKIGFELLIYSLNKLGAPSVLNKWYEKDNLKN